MINNIQTKKKGAGPSRPGESCAFGRRIAPRDPDFARIPPIVINH
jgi:hypothetical protein